MNAEIAEQSRQATQRKTCREGLIKEKTDSAFYPFILPFSAFLSSLSAPSAFISPNRIEPLKDHHGASY